MANVPLPSRPSGLGGRGRVRRLVASHLESHDVSRVIYGAIIGLALVVALQWHPPTAGQAAAAILVTAVAVAMAEVYSELIGTEARTRRPIRARQARAAAAEGAAVLFGAGFPAIFFVLAAVGLLDTSLAFDLSKWTGLGLICAYGYVAGRLSGSSVGGALVHAAGAGTIGGVLIAIKALLH